MSASTVKGNMTLNVKTPFTIHATHIQFFAIVYINDEEKGIKNLVD